MTPPVTRRSFNPSEIQASTMGMPGDTQMIPADAVQPPVNVAPVEGRAVSPMIDEQLTPPVVEKAEPSDASLLEQ